MDSVFLRRLGAIVWLSLGLAWAATAAARGVSPYLPFNLDPAIERDVERVLALAERPVMTRPIAAAIVRDALPRACAIDRALCERVARYIAGFMPSTALTHLSVEGAAADGDNVTLANRHGLTTDSAWAVSARAHWQPLDHALLSLGGVAFDGVSTATGSMLSVGFDTVQLDIGYREHGFSPFTDSAMLIGSHAPAMPSITLSNYRPLTRWGITYEGFIAEMSESARIAFEQRLTSGKPRLAGAHIAIHPAPGFSLGANRLIQFGGGERGGRSFSDFWRAFFDPSRFDNTGPSLTADQQFGNQLGAFTSRLLIPGRTPFAVYFEYAGEDTSRGRNYLLGNAAISAGVDFPKLPVGLDATVELSEWQSGWYVNSLYGDGLSNEGRGIGHWFVDRRVRGDAVGGQSQMLRVGWAPRFGGAFEFRYRTSANDDYSANDYERSRELTVGYSRLFGGWRIGAEVEVGRDIFGADYSRAAAHFRWSGERAGLGGWLEETTDAAVTASEVFLSVGANLSSVDIDLDTNTQLDTNTRSAAHFAVGVRRTAGARSDVGARIEFDKVDGRALLGLRALDYRYRVGEHMALSGFIGAARYDLATPAYGTYLGVGAEWREILPNWSASVDVKYALKVARDRVLPSEAGQFQREDAFYDIQSAVLYVTRKF